MRSTETHNGYGNLRHGVPAPVIYLRSVHHRSGAHSHSRLRKPSTTILCRVTGRCIVHYQLVTELGNVCWRKVSWKMAVENPTKCCTVGATVKMYTNISGHRTSWKSSPEEDYLHLRWHFSGAYWKWPSNKYSFKPSTTTVSCSWQNTNYKSSVISPDTTFLAEISPTTTTVQSYHQIQHSWLRYHQQLQQFSHITRHNIPVWDITNNYNSSVISPYTTFLAEISPTTTRVQSYHQIQHSSLGYHQQLQQFSHITRHNIPVWDITNNYNSSVISPDTTFLSEISPTTTRVQSYHQIQHSWLRYHQQLQQFSHITRHNIPVWDITNNYNSSVISPDTTFLSEISPTTTTVQSYHQTQHSCLRYHQQLQEFSHITRHNIPVWDITNNYNSSVILPDTTFLAGISPTTTTVQSYHHIQHSWLRYHQQLQEFSHITRYNIPRWDITNNYNSAVISPDTTFLSEISPTTTTVQSYHQIQHSCLRYHQQLQQFSHITRHNIPGWDITNNYNSSVISPDTTFLSEISPTTTTVQSYHQTQHSCLRYHQQLQEFSHITRYNIPRWDITNNYNSSFISPDTTFLAEISPTTTTVQSYHQTQHSCLRYHQQLQQCSHITRYNIPGWYITNNYNSAVISPDTTFLAEISPTTTTVQSYHQIQHSWLRYHQQLQQFSHITRHNIPVWDITNNYNSAVISPDTTFLSEISPTTTTVQSYHQTQHSCLRYHQQLQQFSHITRYNIPGWDITNNYKSSVISPDTTFLSEISPTTTTVQSYHQIQHSCLRYHKQLQQFSHITRHNIPVWDITNNYKSSVISPDTTFLAEISPTTTTVQSYHQTQHSWLRYHQQLQQFSHITRHNIPVWDITNNYNSAVISPDTTFLAEISPTTTTVQSYHQIQHSWLRYHQQLQQCSHITRYNIPGWDITNNYNSSVISPDTTFLSEISPTTTTVQSYHQTQHSCLRYHQQLQQFSHITRHNIPVWDITNNYNSSVISPDTTFLAEISPTTTRVQSYHQTQHSCLRYHQQLQQFSHITRYNIPVWDITNNYNSAVISPDTTFLSEISPTTTRVQSYHQTQHSCLRYHQQLQQFSHITRYNIPRWDITNNYNSSVISPYTTFLAEISPTTTRVQSYHQIQHSSLGYHQQLQQCSHITRHNIPVWDITNNYNSSVISPDTTFLSEISPTTTTVQSYHQTQHSWLRYHQQLQQFSHITRHNIPVWDITNNYNSSVISPETTFLSEISPTTTRVQSYHQIQHSSLRYHQQLQQFSHITRHNIPGWDITNNYNSSVISPEQHSCLRYHQQLQQFSHITRTTFLSEISPTTTTVQSYHQTQHSCLRYHQQLQQFSHITRTTFLAEISPTTTTVQSYHQNNIPGWDITNNYNSSVISPDTPFLAEISYKAWSKIA